jgi:hypothetical protein
MRYASARLLATCGVAGVCSDLHGEAVAACGGLYSAPPARAVCGGTRRGAAGSVHRLCRCVHGAPRHGLRASTVSVRQPRGSHFPGHAPLTSGRLGAPGPHPSGRSGPRAPVPESVRAPRRVKCWNRLLATGGVLATRPDHSALCDADAAAKQGRWWRPRGRGAGLFPAASRRGR